MWRCRLRQCPLGCGMVQAGLDFAGGPDKAGRGKILECPQFLKPKRTVFRKQQRKTCPRSGFRGGARTCGAAVCANVRLGVGWFGPAWILLAVRLKQAVGRSLSARSF